ncbi:protein FAR1-RELATED SEQUENCE 6-like [Chenopodium quinoa]|uniref:protein FAR1-RELATED SEQUENCE 6-like n=1 Tax=Chenopodium quinoa TaxID=63459 RepID=UPI000B789899|nr:protein FAR1-RELATED SEQUENCE 6-like [Chenopodium quinoa]
MENNDLQLSSVEEQGHDIQSDPLSDCFVPVIVSGEGPSQECPPSGLVSPMKTIETVETIVSTNKVSAFALVETPRVGMVFKSWQDVECYYKQYAEQKGFGVTRAQGYSSKKDKVRRGITWKCECWGHPDMRASREAKKRAKSMDVGGTSADVDGVVLEDELARGKRTSKKCLCEAKIYGSVNEDGLWVLRKVILDHTHLVSPTKSKLVKEYRMKNYTTNVRRNLITFFDEGVSVPQIHGCLGLGKDGENCPTVKDLQHEVYKERKARLNMAGGDCAAMMEYFERMQADNSNFYHFHRIDGEGRMKDVMWVDARSRAAFE